MKTKKIFRLSTLFIFLFLPVLCWAQVYFTGDGGRGMRLAVLEPAGRGLSMNQDDWIPSFIQSSITGYFQKYSAVTVVDRQNSDKILAEQKQLLSGNNTAAEYIIIGRLINARYILAGSVVKAPNAYLLELTVTDAESGERKASYPSNPIPSASLEDLSALKEVTADLLEQLGITLTDGGLADLKSTGNLSRAPAEAALAKGIVAQKQGAEITALSCYFQAAALDPTLAEALSRSSVLASGISSGVIGDGARNDAQWRSAWTARLAETEQYFNSFFDNFLKTVPMPFTMLYSTDVKQIGEINPQNETVTLSGVQAQLQVLPNWTESIEAATRSMQKVIQTVLDGLNATKRKAAWGMDKWPQQGSFNLKPFEEKKSNNFEVVIELVSSMNKIIGRETFQTGGTYQYPVPLPGRNASVSISTGAFIIVDFKNVKTNDVTKDMTVRVVSINGTPAETAARTGILPLQVVSENLVKFITVQGLKYDAKGVITGYTGSITAIEIPEMIDRVKITSIGDNVFKDRQITRVSIPDGITSIGKSAFANNQLTSVTIPDGVTSIGESAFSDNRLTSIIIPKGVTSIGARAFFGNRLASINLPNSVTSIGNAAFVFSLRGDEHRPGTITIGANMRLTSSMTYKDFVDFYNGNQKKSGVYTYKDMKWSYSGR